MSRISRLSTRMLASSWLAGLAAIGPLHAQETPPPEPAAPPQTASAEQSQGGLEDIIVTAQKKSENLQTVPIAVSAVTGQAIADAHIATLQGLQGVTPNIQINNFSNTPNTAVFTIRGIGIIEPDPYAGNTVSIVYDGVPQYFSMGALLDVYDIDRVEILRGPQGTLFGANTTGGVVNVVTVQPDLTKFAGKFDASYGNWNHLTIGGAVNTPFSDTLAGRFVFNHDQRDGWVTNVVDGSDMGKRDVTQFRAALKFAPTDDLDATLMTEYVMARNGSPIVVAGDIPGEAEFVPAGFRNMYESPCLPPGTRCDAPDKYLSANDSVPDKSDMDTFRAGLTINWANTGIGDITSITAYKDFKLFEFTDQDGTPVFLIDTRRGTKGWQFSQELRTSIDFSDSINVIVGGFYLKDHYKHYQDLRIDFAGGVTYDLATDTVTKGLPGLFQKNLQDQDNWSGSLFVQSYIDLTDSLRLQAGIRYTHEKTTMEASTLTTLAPGGVTTFDGTAPDGTPNILIGNVAPPRDSKSWDNVGWKIGLDYEVAPGAMIYGYWARGFKSGGFTGRIGIPQDLGPYDPEEVDTFEVGAKADFLDRRLRTNLAVFYTNYRDMQLAQIYFVGSGASLVQGNTILNAASSRIKGFELDVTALPVDGLTLTGSVAYLDAKYKNFPYSQPDGSTLDLDGERLQNAPKWAAAAGATYEFDVGQGSVRANVLYSYTSEKLLTSIVDTPRARVQPTHLVNANLDWMPTGETFTVGLWARNLLDNRYIASVFDSPGTLGLTNYAPPREYGASVKVEF
ncbi:TonB-dependent receptor [Sphingomonas sp. DBB INV C78]|uniref:TonB-dependent receptor n=1 Tax=Sphingomonas sp. DBB INV C78 TaxID=3349434 RepID=UPI0036D32A4C